MDLYCLKTQRTAQRACLEKGNPSSITWQAFERFLLFIAVSATAVDRFAACRIFEFIKKWKDTLVVRFKIIVAHFQVVGTFPQVLDVQWPEAFNR